MTTMVTCDSCDGEGYHGIEEDTGCPYTCYACYGTGMVPAETDEDLEARSYESLMDQYADHDAFEYGFN